MEQYLVLQTSRWGEIDLLFDPRSLEENRIVPTRKAALELAESILEILAQPQDMPVSEMDS